MLTNPVPPPSAQPNANRPTLKIAVRSTQHPDDPKPGAAGLIPHEVGAWHSEWRSTLETVKATLAGLEQACESAIVARESQVAGLIDTLVQGTAAQVTSAAEQTREQAEIAIRELQQESLTLQQTVETLQAGLEAERENVNRLSTQLDAEVAARVRAESERDELQRRCQAQAEAVEAQAEALRAELDAEKARLALARQQLDAASAERSQLMTTFRLVQRALALSVPADMARAASAEEGIFGFPSEAGAVQPPPAPEVVPVEAPNTVEAARRALIEAHPEAVEDITCVLKQVEAMYHQDVQSGWSGIEVVDRLTPNLRHARSLIIARWTTDTFDAQKLFEHQLDVLREAQAGTSFERHLGIALYALGTPDRSAGQEK